MIDQFEEALVSTPEEVRHTFIREVARILDASVGLTVVLTLRDDFYSRFLQDAAMLTSWLERGLVNIPPALEREELRAMVMLPAKQVGISFEDGLVDMILADAAEADRTKGMTRSTILPLLEFALTQLWERRREGWLTHDAYHNIVGGVAGSLSQWADQAYRNLTYEEREMARHILSDLVRPGNEAQGIPDTRRVRPLTKLIHRNETLARRVIDRLIRVRLLSTWRDEETSLEKVEIIHEALLREWGLLRDWLRENQIFLAWRDSLENQIRKWEESGTDEAGLLQGLPLLEAEGWLSTRSQDIGATGRQYIELGIAVREREKAAKQLLVKQTERLQTLRAIDLAINSSFDLQNILMVLIQEVIKQLDVDAACVLMIQPENGRLGYVAGQGFKTHNIETTHLRIGEEYAGRAALQRTILAIPDLTKESGKSIRAGLLAEENFVSYYAVPLITKGLVKGVMEIFHRSRLTPDREWLDFLETLAGQTAIAIEISSLFQSLQRSNQELVHAYNSTIEGWARALDLRDRETEGHTQRVTMLTLQLARTLGVKDSELVHIHRGALLHDVGKLGIPDAILHKPGPLTDEEQRMMHQHPPLAYNLLVPIPFLRPALDIPYCHHEKWDGSGYPRGLKGEEIPLAARIFTIVDAFDALTSDRPYRRGLPNEEALQYIREQAGRQFDPNLVEVFLDMISK
jgi:HD-GYP domain-containing protein (c-di-GMP phosphodiesterase class II)